MYQVIFSFMLIHFLFVSGQSPCPDNFDYYRNDRGVYGLITIQPFGNVSTVNLDVKFTIGARVPPNYDLSILLPVGSELDLLDNFNRGVPLRYQVSFPATSPIPKLIELTVNNAILCQGPGDKTNSFNTVTTITLQHTLYYKTQLSGFYENSIKLEPKPAIIPTKNSLGDYNAYVIKDRSIFNVDNNRPTLQGNQAPRPVQSGTSNSLECGINSSNEPVALEFQGYSYDRGEWPWLVAVYKSQSLSKSQSSSLSYICAGTLISSQHVVSAAQCVRRKTELKLSNIIVKAGVYNLDDWSDISVHKVTAADIHESYNSTTLESDILVLTLDKMVPFGEYIKPACLWNGDTDLSRIVGTSGVLASWGAIAGGQRGMGQPLTVRMPIVSTTTCRASNPAFLRITSSKTLCAGSRDGSGPCLGDAGGGLYILDNGRWRLRGVVSLAIPPDDPEVVCNLNEYIVFTDVAQYLPWIKEIISKTSP